MDDALLMGGFEGFCDLFGNRKCLVNWDWSLSNPVSEGRPLHQLQHQRSRVVGFFNTVDGRDARMVKAGQHLRLSLEPGQPIRISREGFRQDLQRHLTVQLRISGLIHPSHAPLADEGGDIVVAESGADFESHGL